MGYGRLAASALALAALAPGGAPAAVSATPPNPYVDKGVCPFECCTYRDWTTKTPVTLLDRPNGSATVTTVAAKTVVRGLTGDVHSTPLRIVASHSYPESPIAKGDVFYALHYSGEGSWAVWYNGKVVGVELDDADADEKKVNAKWWAKIKTKEGKIGWVEVRSQFGNQDDCG